MPRVLNRHRDGHPPGSVYVGRGTPWGNPFRAGPDGPRSVVLGRFRDEVLPSLDVSALRGRDLVCSCAPKPCHADMLLRKANPDMSAVLSDCGTYRYRLDRELQAAGIVICYLGVNPSTADAEREDATTRRWRGFALREGARRYVAVNPFAYRATDVKELAAADDPVGPLNDWHIDEALHEADLIVPCWGSRAKLPGRLRPRLAEVRRRLFLYRAPLRTFGLTASGDPLHPLMLANNTPLVPLET
jgi:hypothetical protein